MDIQDEGSAPDTGANDASSSNSSSGANPSDGNAGGHEADSHSYESSHETSDNGQPKAAGGEGKAPDHKKSRFESVLKVLGLSKKEGDDKPAPQEGGDNQDGDPAEQQQGDAAKKPDGKVPPEVANHPAFKGLTEENTRLRGDADRFQRMDKFFKDNKVSPQQVTNAMTLTALMNNDPDKFLDRINGIRDEFMIRLGKGLPADLQKDVDEGAISPERAKELANARVRAGEAERTAKDATDQSTAVTSRESEQARTAFVNRWFDNQMKKDPELGKKTDLIEREITSLIQRFAPPRNDTEMNNLLNAAYKNVNATLQKFQPARKSIKPDARAQQSPALGANNKEPATRADIVARELAKLNSKRN